MAMPRRIKVEFGDAFPHGLYMPPGSEVTEARDFDKSTKDKPVQAVDPETGQRVWSVDVIDGDPEALKSGRSLSVRILSDRQPVPPEAPDGMPFRPVAFEGLSATPYVDDRGNGRPRLAWSFRATGFADPKPATAKSNARASQAKDTAGAA